MTTKSTHGGKRANAGRKPEIGASVVYTLRVSPEQRAKIDAMGGPQALRDFIDAFVVPKARKRAT